MDAILRPVGSCCVPSWRGIAAAYEDRSDLVTDRVQAHFRTCGVRIHKAGTGHVVEKDENAAETRAQLIDLLGNADAR